MDEPDIEESIDERIDGNRQWFALLDLVWLMAVQIRQLHNLAEGWPKSGV